MRAFATGQCVAVHAQCRGEHAMPCHTRCTQGDYAEPADIFTMGANDPLPPPKKRRYHVST